MASSSADCVLGGVRLIFVGQQNVAEERTGDERPAAVAGGRVLLDDVGAGDVGGHQVRRELDALEHQAQRLRDGAHQQRLGRAGQAGDQAVAADEQRGEDLVDDLLLADDHFLHLPDDAGRERTGNARCAALVRRSSDQLER